MKVRFRNRMVWVFIAMAVIITFAMGRNEMTVQAAEAVVNGSDGAGNEETGTPGTSGADTGSASTADPVDISGDTFSISFSSNEEYIYTGSAIEPTVAVIETVTEETTGTTEPTVTEETTGSTEATEETTGSNTTEKTWVSGTDYTVTYENNVNAGTATVTIKPVDTENYTGEKTLSFTIQPKNINDLEMTVKDKEYAGRELKPNVSMSYNGTKLVRKTDYTIIKYENNTDVGTATAVVKGKGNYTGKRTMTFNITAKNLYDLTFSPDISGKKYTYNGTAITPTVTITMDVEEDNKVVGTKTLAKDVDYTITYVDNNRVGSAGLMIIGKGNFSGSRVMTFTIRPPKTTIKKLKKGKNKITVKWTKKTSQVTGYIIQCSTKKNFSSSVKQITVKKQKAKAVFKKLKSKKKYYVRIRTYKNVAGLKYYSAWSNVVSIKTK